MPRRAEFDTKHPLWEEFIRLRQSGAFVTQLVALASERGHPLSYRQITRGLQKAQFVKHLPSRSSHWLQKRVQDMDAKIDALETMHGLAALSAEKLYDIQTELSDRELPFMRRTALEKLEKDERKTLWGFCRDIVNIEMGLGLRDIASADARQHNTTILPGSQQDLVRQLAEEMIGLMRGGVRTREVIVEGEVREIPVPEVVQPHAMLKELGQAREPGEIWDGDEEGEEAPDFEESV